MGRFVVSPTLRPVRVPPFLSSSLLELKQKEVFLHNKEPFYISGNNRLGTLRESLQIVYLSRRKTHCSSPSLTVTNLDNECSTIPVFNYGRVRLRTSEVVVFTVVLQVRDSTDGTGVLSVCHGTCQTQKVFMN